MPGWVQAWVTFILGPVNLASVAFVSQPFGGGLATLVLLGMALNLPIMIRDRGLSKLMAVPHVALWTPAVALMVWLLTAGPALAPAFATYLVILLVVDLISLGFDYKDSVDWLRGDRAPA